jgi:hypothetical protein
MLPGTVRPVIQFGDVWRSRFVLLTWTVARLQCWLADGSGMARDQQAHGQMRRNLARAATARHWSGGQVQMVIGEVDDDQGAPSPRRRRAGNGGISGGPCEARRPTGTDSSGEPVDCISLQR